MKIAWLSSWPPRACGIATYSNELVSALRSEGNEVHIVCHPDGGADGEKNIYPVIDISRHGWDEDVYEAVKQIEPDVVHIQHEYGLYNTNKDNASALFRPLFRWKTEKRPATVVTYHSVYAELNPMISSYMDVMQSLVEAGIVHAEYQWANLHANLGRVIENIYIIPHGASERKPFPKNDMKKRYGLAGKKIIGMLGWFTRTKGFHRVLAMWDEISSTIGSDTVIVLAGDARQGDPNQVSYKAELLDAVDKCRERDRIKVILGSFSSDEYEKILSSFDAMVMPYQFASQSGNLAHSFSLGVPVVVTALEGLKAEVEASGAGIAVPPEDEAELKRAIISMMLDESLREQFSNRAMQYVRNSISWKLIAQKHIQVYNEARTRSNGRPASLRDRAQLKSSAKFTRGMS